MCCHKPLDYLCRVCGICGSLKGKFEGQNLGLQEISNAINYLRMREGRVCQGKPCSRVYREARA